MAVDLQLVITTALSSGAAVVLVEYGLHVLREHKEKKRHTEFLALGVCVCLERYAIRVADEISDERETETSPGQYLTNVVSHVPSLQPLPESEHYDQFDLKILAKIYEFPDRISLANGFASYIDTIQDREDAIIYATQQACLIATAAIDLATEIRTKYGLPERLLVHGQYDVRKTLKNHDV